MRMIKGWNLQDVLSFVGHQAIKHNIRVSADETATLALKVAGVE